MHINVRDLNIEDEPSAEQVALIGLLDGGVNPKQFGYTDEEITAVAHRITSEEGQVAVVRFNFYLISQIPNACEKAQLEVVRQNPDHIKHIRNPTDKVQIQAVTMRSDTLRWVKNPCKEAQVITASNINAKHDAKESIKRITNPEAVKILVNRFQVEEIMEL